MCGIFLWMTHFFDLTLFCYSKAGKSKSMYGGAVAITGGESLTHHNMYSIGGEVNLQGGKSNGGVGGKVVISGGESKNDSGGVELETPDVLTAQSSGSVSIQTGSFQEGRSGDVQIRTGSMKPMCTVEGRPGNVIVQSGSAGNEEAYHNGQKLYGYRYHSRNDVQSQGGGLSLSSGDSFDGAGGETLIASGSGLFEGGTVNVTSGFGVKSNGGDLYLGGGSSRDKAGGNVNLAAGTSSSSESGSIRIGGGQGFRKGSISLIGSNAVSGDGKQREADYIQAL